MAKQTIRIDASFVNDELHSRLYIAGRTGLGQEPNVAECLGSIAAATNENHWHTAAKRRLRCQSQLDGIENRQADPNHAYCAAGRRTII